MSLPPFLHQRDVAAGVSRWLPFRDSICPTIGKIAVSIFLAAALNAPAAKVPPQDAAEVPPFNHPLRVVKISASTSTLVQLSGQWLDPVSERDREGRAADLSASQAPVSDSLRLIQLNEPLNDAIAGQLRAAGVKVLGFIPENTLIVELQESRITAARNLQQVRWLGNYAPEYRFSERLNKAMRRPARPGYEREFNVRIFLAPGYDAMQTLTSARALGGADYIGHTASGAILEAKVRGSQLMDLAALPGVAGLDYAPQPHSMNNVAADIVLTRPVWTQFGYFGSNETVAVADSGLDVCSNSTDQLQGEFRDGAGNARVVFLQDYSGDGAHDPISGHGTHVAGSVLGNGFYSGADPATHTYPATSYAGSAPEARLVFQALGRSTNSSAIYPPTNLNMMFQAAYTNGARIHQNSWGSDADGAYEAQTREVDEFTFNNPEMLVCYSAGNAGVDGNSDGVVDLGSIGSPGSAKNCLTVGASENDRSTFTMTYGSGWPADFPADPIASDRVANQTNGMAAFSSRGPCADGRIKPDLVAPGAYIASARSHAIPSASNILWGIVSGNTNYNWSGGTSMSSPLVSGAAAVLREYLRLQRGLTNPPAALMKAILLNGTIDMSPGQYGTGAARETTNAPNCVEGWGRLALSPLFTGSSSYEMRYVNGALQPFTNEAAFSTNMIVHDSNLPLRVHLAWTDFPGSWKTFDTNFSTTAGGGLVNDLDLILVAPDGSPQWPQERDTRVGLYYYTNNSRLSWFNNAEFSQAELCRAPELPLTLTHIQQIAYDTNTLGGDIATFVWAGSDTGGAPRAVLFAQTNTVPAGGGIWHLDVPMNIVITTRYFFVGSKQITGSRIRQPRDSGGKSTRTAYSSGGAWTSPDNYGDLWIHVFGTALTNDHVNTVEGIFVDRPATGAWTLAVSAAHLSHAPVTWGVAYSGGLKPASNSPPAAPILHSPANCPDYLNDGLIDNDDFALYGRTLNPSPRLIWHAPLDPDGENLHFQIYCDTTNASLLAANSSNSVAGFEYFDGTSWGSFPPTGAPGDNSNGKIRFKPAAPLPTGTSYYWRVTAHDSEMTSLSSSTNRFVIGLRTWTDPNLPPLTTLIRKIYLDELREEANYARACRVLPTNHWEAITPHQTPIRAGYFTNLYLTIAETTNLTGETVAPYPSITPKITPVGTNFIHQLRKTLEGI
ncbi:MAG TPA: hypothetical protein DCZ95_20080 [Verrucomicrobia bacterium]|nr:MAG: hypothetical protein A2X46_02925 [Lentisphaerae bacterium GWF2_57_35]HBA86385.1 hypothetical protein [Verrucomicrobiota bacterium]